MASPLLARAPRCMSCIRHLTVSFDAASQTPSRQQIRGKKKIAKITTVKVHLLQNVPGFGRRGAVVPVTAGMMRNIWYPRKMAEYMTFAKMQELGVKRTAVAERDSTFGTKRERELEKQKEKVAEVKSKEEAPVSITAVELDMLSPPKAISVLEKLLPGKIDFYRTPINTSQPTQPVKKVSPSIPSTSIISSAIADSNQAIDQQSTSIFGSVSTNDIAANLKAILAEDVDGARVSLSAEDISFIDKTEDLDRVKHLGRFEFEIRLHGVSEAVRRSIQVKAQD